jgi:hypothetical protein
MKVAVIGSWREETKKYGWDLRQGDYFEDFCIEIGKCLAKNNHELIVARIDNNSQTADRFVHNGYKMSKFKKDQGPVLTIVEHLQHQKIWAKSHIRCVDLADAVIVIGGADGTYIAGQEAIMRKKRLLPLPLFGGAALELYNDFRRVIDPQYISELEHQTSLSFSEERMKVSISKLIEALHNFPRILIIHGRSDDKIKLKKFLTKEIKINNLPPPVIMNQKVRSGEVIPEFFEKLASETDGAIALVTAEDIGASAIDNKGKHYRAIDISKISPRARQNVWVEVGWFWGRMGRDRIMLLNRGDIDFPSDLESIIRHEYREHPGERKIEIERFINGIRRK